MIETMRDTKLLRRSTRAGLMASVLGSAGMLAAMDATPVHAQAAAPAATVAPGEIIVTANRRDQKLRDVGIAVTVLSSKEIRNLSITNATDVVRAVPNLKFNAYGSSQVVFNIRGVSQNDYGDQQEPPVAVYQDDSYSASITSASFPIFDLSRVEALRGPQGTLFGRNATGGAVQFISNQPTDKLGGYITGTYGRFNQAIVEGALSGPLTDTLTARISGQYDRDDGYIKDITPGQPNRGADNHWGLRGIFLWQPSSDFKAKLTLRYTEADHERQAGIYTLAPACPNAQYQGEFLAVGQSCSYWGTTNGGTANGYVNPSITPSQGGNPWETAGTGDAYVDRKVFGSSLRMDAHLGAIDLTSITDYTYLKKYYIEMGDGDPEQAYTGTGSSSNPVPQSCGGAAASVLCYASGTVFSQRARTDQYTQELRASTSFGRNFLTVGAFGMIINGKFGAKYATPFDGYDPTVDFTQRTTSFAFFAQDEYKITDTVKLIGGVRYWQDHKRAYYNAIDPEGPYALSLHFGPDGISYNDMSGTVTPASWSYGSGATSGVTITPSAAAPTFRGVTARAEIDWKPTPDTLLYASYNRGSKSGGFTLSTGTPYPTQLIDTLNNIPYKPETLDDYEVGLKTNIAHMVQFNLDGFYYDYHNYQAFVQVFAAQLVRNLPAMAMGLEAEATAHPIHGLTLQGNATLQKSRVHDVLLPDGATVVTHNLPQAAGFTAGALARYEWDLFGGRASIQGDMQYTGKFCFTVMCAPVEQEGAYHTENARIGFSPAGGNIDLAFFVNNIANRAYRVYAFDGSTYWGDVLGVYAKPRTWGISATYRFGKQ